MKITKIKTKGLSDFDCLFDLSIIQLPLTGHMGLSGTAAIAAVKNKHPDIFMIPNNFKSVTIDFFIERFNSIHNDSYLQYSCMENLINDQIEFAKYFSEKYKTPDTKTIDSTVSIFRGAVKSMERSSKFTIDSFTKEEGVRVGFTILEILKSKRKYNNFLKEKLWKV